MLFHRLYFALKPYLPWEFRIRLRRLAAHRKLLTHSRVWPINEAAGEKPMDWPGWPGGKKFAVVLTHDVEGAKGLARSQELAELELRLGFRSSFNFVPEGSYRTPKSLRDWLTGHGFEIGVHDLNHDGRLYLSRDGFRRRALRINQYLQEWNASGFRAGFMYHNSVWLHDLNLQYDASTFDTDPFEPQPDPADTIFPFWVPAPAASETHSGATAASSPRPGYVELPYTLPQDSTLFLLLNEPTPAIWMKKVDWIARRGGMVLVNVHPDYLGYQATRTTGAPRVLDHYEELLRYLTTRHRDAFWHALPHEVAAFIRTHNTSAPRLAL